MGSKTIKESEASNAPPRQEYRMSVEADNHTDKCRLANSLDEITMKNNFYKQSARSVASALKAERYVRARRKAIRLLKYDDVPLECSVTCFWALAKASEHYGAFLLAQEYLEMYILCITDLIKIDAEHGLPVDESKLTLKSLGQLSLDQVIAEIQAEIKAGEAVEDDSDSSASILYMKGKTKENKEEEKEHKNVKGGRKRRNAQVGEEVSLKKLAERKILVEQVGISTSPRQKVLKPKAPTDGGKRDNSPKPSQYDSLVTTDTENAVEEADEEDDFAHETGLDEVLMFPRAWPV